MAFRFYRLMSSFFILNIFKQLLSASIAGGARSFCRPKGTKMRRLEDFLWMFAAEAWIMLPENLAMPEFCVNGDVMLELDMVVPKERIQMNFF